MGKKNAIPMLDDELMTSEEALAKATMILAETKNPKTMTRINESEIKLLSSLVTLGDHFDIPIMKDICQNFMKLRVSHKGLGRNEILQIAKYAREEKSEQSRLRRLFAFGGRM